MTKSSFTKCFCSSLDYTTLVYTLHVYVFVRPNIFIFCLWPHDNFKCTEVFYFIYISEFRSTNVQQKSVADKSQKTNHVLPTETQIVHFNY